MSALVSALDSKNNKQLGENNSIEYSWSNKLNDKITQFFFQLVRCDNHNDISKRLTRMLNTIKGNEIKYEKQLRLLYKLIGQTRDIVDGKGEQKLAFTQVWVWYSFYPELAKNALAQFFVLKENSSLHQWGSWKDVKYWCEFVKNKTQNENHEMINFVLEIADVQLKKDVHMLNGANEGNDQAVFSLLGRWFPREKSKFGWVFKKYAKMRFHKILDTAKTSESKRLARIKAYITLKKVLVSLNKKLDTPQIKMTAVPGEWSKLDFNHVTSKTLMKSRKAIMNITKANEIRSHIEDRINCAKNYHSHVEAAKSEPKKFKIHGKRLNTYELVKEAMNINTGNKGEKDTINLQWQSNKQVNAALEDLAIISMVDTSGSMEIDECTPLYNAIGLGIRTSELSHPAFRNRVLTFDSIPKWIDLSKFGDDFVSKVRYVKGISWGMSTNFYRALKMILDTIIENNIPPSEVENMILAVYSDMQIDPSWSGDGNMNVMFDNIKEMYRDAGLNSSYNKPYNAPHIIFWNLRKTTGFPSKTSDKNVTFMSGYSSTLLNEFCDKGMNVIKNYTPSTMLTDLLDNPRYNVLNACVDELINKKNVNIDSDWGKVFSSAVADGVNWKYSNVSW